MIFGFTQVVLSRLECGGRCDYLSVLLFYHPPIRHFNQVLALSSQGSPADFHGKIHSSDPLLGRPAQDESCVAWRHHAAV